MLFAGPDPPSRPYTADSALSSRPVTRGEEGGAGSRPMTPTQRMQQELAASQRKRLQRLQVSSHTVRSVSTTKVLAKGTPQIWREQVRLGDELDARACCVKTGWLCMPGSQEEAPAASPGEQPHCKMCYS